MRWEAADRPTGRVLSEEVSGVDDAGKVVDLVPFEIKSFLVVEQLRVVQYSLVHELQGLGNKEDRKNDEVDRPSDTAILDLLSVKCHLERISRTFFFKITLSRPSRYSA